MHKTKVGIVFVGIGAVLILFALLIFLYFEVSNAIMEAKSFDIYLELQESIEKLNAEMSKGNEPENASISVNEQIVKESEESSHISNNDSNIGETEPITSNSKMVIVTVNGYDYIGTMEIPAIGLTLPILSDWDYKKLDIAPCRQFGSSKTDDLVIAGHNYKRHFKLLYKLAVGDTILFTDMEGTLVEYTVVGNRTLKATEVDTVQNSGYDLVLYTCTYSGTERTVVFCERKVE